MRFKYYLRGTGIGLIVAALIFTIAINAKGGLMTDEKAIERAKELGYVLATDASGDAAGITNEDLQNASNLADVSGDTRGDSTSDTKEADSLDETDTAAEDMPTDISMTQPVSIMITASESSESVSATLENAGLVEDAEDFNDYLMHNGYDKRLQNGTFQIVPGATYEEIAKTLTGR